MKKRHTITKKTGIIFLLLLVLSSCNQTNKNSNDSKEITSNDSSSTKPPEGFDIGEANAYIGKDKVEKNFISQANSYSSALLKNDQDNMRYYLYPDAVNYFRKLNPEYTNDELYYEFFKLGYKVVQEMDSLYASSGVELSLVVCNIDRKVDLGQNKFFIFEYTSQLFREAAKKIKYIHTKPEFNDKSIGISLNNGKNWTFITMNNDTPNILRLKFSEEVVNKVMGY